MGWKLDQEYFWDGSRPVYLAPQAQKEWHALDAGRRAAMSAVAKRYAAGGDFPENKLVQEDRHSLLGSPTLLFAFKDGDVRMYGVPLDLNKPVLFVVSVVIQKKKQKLDPNDAKKAMKRLEKFLDSQEEEV